MNFIKYALWRGKPPPKKAAFQPIPAKAHKSMGIIRHKRIPHIIGKVKPANTGNP
jgi:hypothetical protein